MADGPADAYSDIDLLWELPGVRFAIGMERLGIVLAAIRPVESLPWNPLLQPSRRHLLVASLPGSSP